MQNDLIKKSYNKIMLILCCTGFSVPVYIALAYLLQQLVSSSFVWFTLLIYMVLWLVAVFSQYKKLDIFYGIYRKWKKSDNISEKEVLGAITFKDIRSLKKFKQERKEQILSGDVVEGFTMKKYGTFGCIFYSSGKTHTFTYVIIDTKKLLTIPLMFDKSIYPILTPVDTRNVKILFSNWVIEHGYNVEHLMLYKRGLAYNPDK